MFSLTQIIMVLALLAALTGGGIYVYTSYTHLVRQEQLLRDQTEVLKNQAKQQAETIRQSNEIIDLNNQALNAFNAQVEGIKANFGKINEYLDSDDAKAKDRPASDILKRVIEELSKGTP